MYLRKFRWLVGLVLVTLLGGCAGRPRSESPAAGAPYLRIRTDTDGTIRLESALREFRRPGRAGGRILLAGVLHLGTPEYYAALQARVDREAVVLFEGVGASEPGFQDASGSGYSLQPALAEALGLTFQLDAMDYRRPHFHNSDLSLEQLGAVLEGSAPEAIPQMEQLMGMMDGSGWIGGLVRFGVGLIRASPKLQATTRLVLIETLGGLEGDLTELTSVPEDMRALLRVLIRERNDVVLADLERWDATRPRPARVGVLYGAGHMADLERRLRETTGCRSVGEEWLTAFSVNPGASGLAAAEVELARRLARAQLELLGARVGPADVRSPDAVPAPVRETGP